MTQYTKPTVLPAWGESAGGADVLQPTNAEIQAGWSLSNVPPSRKRFNWILKYLAQGVRYMMQMGIPVWDSTEDYPVNARVMGSDGKTYKCILTGINKDPTTQPTYWTRWGFTLAELAAEQTTPAQFDNSTKTVTTAFQAGAGLRFQNVAGLGIAVSTTLNISNSGHWIEPQTAGITITLPALSAAPPGLVTYSFRAIQSFILKGSAAETIMDPMGANANTLSVAKGETLTVVSNGNGGNWYVVANGFGSPTFAKSLASNGYQKFPSGLIIQWGSCSLGYGGALASATGTQVTSTLPITFPNAFTAITVFHNGGIPQCYAAQIINTSQFNTSTSYGSSIGGTFIAIGY